MYLSMYGRAILYLLWTPAYNSRGGAIQLITEQFNKFSTQVGPTWSGFVPGISTSLEIVQCRNTSDVCRARARDKSKASRLIVL